MKRLETFLTTPIGSALRVFAGLLLGFLVAYLGDGGDLRAIDVDTLWAWIGAALAVAVPILIAWVNPADGRFGVGSSG